MTSDSLGRLAETAKLPLARAHAALQQSGLLGPATILSPAQATQALDLPSQGVGRWVLWAELVATAPLLPPSATSGHGALGVRWLGDGLPLVCVTLTSLDRTVRIGVLLWSAAARRWLADVLAHRQLTIVLDSQTGSSSLSTGDIEIAGHGMSDLLNFEYSVQPEDRGHAISAAAVMLLAQGGDQGHAAVHITAETPADFAELTMLQVVSA